MYKQNKRARQPAIKPLWPADSVGEKQKCQHRVPKQRNIPAVTLKTLSFGKNKKGTSHTPTPPTPPVPFPSNPSEPVPVISPNK